MKKTIMDRLSESLKDVPDSVPLGAIFWVMCGLQGAFAIGCFIMALST